MPTRSTATSRHCPDGAVPRLRRQWDVHLPELHRRWRLGVKKIRSAPAGRNERAPPVNAAGTFIDHQQRRTAVTSIKRLLRGAALAIGLVSAGSLAAPAAAESLRVLAWEGYADPDWVKEFTAETGIDVNVVFIGTDDEIWAKIKGSEGKDCDV